MFAFLCFIAGVVVGVLYEPALKPIVLTLWGKLKAWFNRHPEDPTP